MAWNGSGTFSRTNGDNTGSTTWQQDKTDGDKITASRHDAHDQDLAEGINNCLAKDGQNAATSDIDFGDNGAVNMADINGVSAPSEGAFTPRLNTNLASSIAYNTQIGYRLSIGELTFGYFHIDADLTSIDTSSPQPLLIVQLQTLTGAFGNYAGGATITEYSGISSVDGLSGSVLNTVTPASIYITKDSGSSTDYVDTLDLSANVVIKGTFVYRRA